MSRIPCAIAIVTYILSGLAAAAGDTPGAAPVVRIPFVIDLTTLRAVSAADGDYESLRVVQSIDAKGYQILVSGEVPGDDGGKLVKIVVPRKVTIDDQKGARKMRTYFHTGDARSFSGTVPGFSEAMINELRGSGKTTFTTVDVAVLFGMSVVKGEFPCELARVAGPAPMLKVLVNGRETSLRTIHAKGSCATEDGRSPEEYFVLDDPANPIILKKTSGGTESKILRIDFPEPPTSSTSLESQLARKEVAQVYGIYFSFNRADIRPESERMLKEIATALKAHPDWKLQVDGHTDGIGDAAVNLDLSQRRAAAVKTALASRYGIAESRLSTGGRGESSPQATNDTPEGRARNRRVELRRI